MAGSSRQGSACLAMAPSGRPIGGRALAPGPLATCRASLANGASIRVAAAAAGISVGREHQGSEAMKANEEEMKRYGFAMDEEGVAKAEQFEKEVARLHKLIEGFGLMLGQQALPCYNPSYAAGVTQLAECGLSKPDVEGSTPFARSWKARPAFRAGR